MFPWEHWAQFARVGFQPSLRRLDALGREVETASGSAYTQILYSPIGKLAVMHAQVPVTTRFPLPGGSTGEITGTSGYYILHSDWLGSARLTSSLVNRTSSYDTAYAPFGESYSTLGNVQSPLNFAGQSQDTGSTGLYDFLYRELNPVQGRWISPDPAGLGAVDPTNPQSWNRYAYVSNMPLVATDPLGLDDCLQHTKGDVCPVFVLDGMKISGMLAGPLLSSGSAVPCPNNDCTGLQFSQGPGGVTQIQTYIPPTSWSHTFHFFDSEGNDDPLYAFGVQTGHWQTVATMPANNGNNLLTAGLVFFKMKNRLVDSGPLNKNFRQPPERNPMEKLLEELKEKADKINDLFDVTMEAIKALSRGGGSVSVPFVIGPPCLYSPNLPCGAPPEI
jgi:RHS repeat-associated protein